MGRRDPHASMEQMLRFAQEAMDLAAGRSRADLDSDRAFELALTHLVELVGESANRVPLDGQARFPEIPWSDIVGQRHRLVHGYDAVDLDVLWATIEQDLPALVKLLVEIRDRNG